MLYAEQFLKFPVILLEDLVKVWGGTDVSGYYWFFGKAHPPSYQPLEHYFNSHLSNFDHMLISVIL
jgi:hypothetical protein